MPLKEERVELWRINRDQVESTRVAHIDELQRIHDDKLNVTYTNIGEIVIFGDDEDTREKFARFMRLYAPSINPEYISLSDL